MTAVAKTDPPPPPPAPPHRPAEQAVGDPIDLGWRVAALYGLSPSKLTSPPVEDLLLNRRSLSAGDRLELELRAIAGVAERVGVPLAAQELEALLGLVAAAAESPEGENRFRDELARTHVALEKRLWANDEAHGRAYELGNFISDTWNRVLRPRATANPHDELLELFSATRVQRMKVLLDNLQSRLDPTAVHVVENHLDSWRDRVGEQSRDAGDGAAATALTPEAAAKKYEPVERQVTIWRQILTGDKEPEAYIGQSRRAEVRDELTRQLWRRYRRLWWIVPIVAVIGGVVGYLVAYKSDLAGGAIGFVTAAAGVLGITQASMIASVRRGVESWGELMWNRSLAAVICRETLVVDELLPPPPQHQPNPPARRASSRS